MTFDKEADLMMVRARIDLIMNEPFYGTLALKLNMVQDATLNPPTLATDGRTMWYHPQWVRDNPHHVRKSAVAHEVGHCVFHHMSRRSGREPVRWNIANDHIVNLGLKESKFDVPDSWCCDAAYAGMTSDQVYNLLPPGTGGGSGGGSSPGQFDDVRDGQTDAGEPDPELAEDWTVETIRAANAARKAGKLPASMARFIGELLDSRADWRTLLQRFINQPAKNDYSWSRFNRRYQSMGLYMPALYSEEMELLVVVTDDSGSIGGKTLQAFAAETAAARDAGRPRKTIVLSCDARVNHVDELERDDPFTLECHGGGGTDFRPPFKWLEERGITPSALVYLTDLEGPFGDDPGFPVMWCCINDNIAPWGETVRVEV